MASNHYVRNEVKRRDALLRTWLARSPRLNIDFRPGGRNPGGRGEKMVGAQGARTLGPEERRRSRHLPISEDDFATG